MTRKNAGWWLCGVALAALLGGCASAPAPKGSYRVFGKTYAPMEKAEGYSETGIASWYGADFHGRRTSSGEVYDMYARTSAHKLLPLGTTVRITNLENGHSATARINDRGPFVDGRIIDLSYTLACDLGIAEKGTARVQVDAIAGPQGAAQTGGPLEGPFVWQVGAYSAPSSAQALAASLRPRFQDVSIEPHRRGEALFYRVRVGTYPTIAAAQEVRPALEAFGFSPFLVRRD